MQRKGGKRDGAGKKPEQEGNSKTLPVCATVSEKERNEIDAARGELSRSEWIRAAILEKLSKGGAE